MGEHGIVCERARAWASLEPDGELSSFEQRLLAAHLERCDPCAAFAQRVEAATFALRAAPPEPLAHPVSVPTAARFARRRLTPRRASYSAVAAAAAAVMALSISSGVSISGGTASVSPRPLVVVTSGDDRADYQALRAYRRLELATSIAAPANSSAHQFGDRST